MEPSSNPDCVNFRVWYDGVFYLSPKKELTYSSKNAEFYKDYDRDCFSKVVLENMFKEDVGLSGIQEMWFLVSGEKMHMDLTLIKSDASCVEMINRCGPQRWLDIYVVKENEVSPLDLTIDGPQPLALQSQPSEFPKNSDSLHSQQPQDGGSDGENESVGEAIGSESSNHGSDSDFVDSGAESEEFNGLDNTGQPTAKSDELPARNVDARGGLDDVAVDADLNEKLPLRTDVLHEPDLDEHDDLDSGFESDKTDGRQQGYPQFNARVDFKHPIKFKHGMIFESNEVFRRALVQHSLENGGDYYFLHNDNNKISAYCKYKCECEMAHGRKKCTCKNILCGFKACARRIRKDGTFQLKTFVGEHKCGWQHKNTKLRSDWLAEKYLEQHRDDPAWRLTAFMSAVKRDYSVDISYNMAWRARVRANVKIHGDAKAQYSKVWDYADTLRKYNDGSSCYVKVCLDNPEKPLFQRIYVCLEACKTGFLKGCRPLIGLDGCHLRGAFTGQVLVAVAKDGNNNIFPVAFAVVEAERKETWGWFIDILMRDIGSANPTIMSDRKKVHLISHC